METEIKIRKTVDFNVYCNELNLRIVASITHHNEGLSSFFDGIDQFKEVVKNTIKIIKLHFPYFSEKQHDPWCYIMHNVLHLQVNFDEIDLTPFDIDFEGGTTDDEVTIEMKKRIFVRINARICENLFNEPEWELW